MASARQLTEFLENVEKRAFKQAVYATQDEHAALDVVQDAMIKLAEKYGDKPAQEFPMLFQRILQNTLLDFFRRKKVRSTWTTLFSSFFSEDEDYSDEFFERLNNDPKNEALNNPAEQLSQEQTLKILEQEISSLPARQREAFLMRYWEDMNVSDTALTMGCSEGSVKTHCSRAVQALAKALKARGIAP